MQFATAELSGPALVWVTGTLEKLPMGADGRPMWPDDELGLVPYDPLNIPNHAFAVLTRDITLIEHLKGYWYAEVRGPQTSARGETLQEACIRANAVHQLGKIYFKSGSYSYLTFFSYYSIKFFSFFLC